MLFSFIKLQHAISVFEIFYLFSTVQPRIAVMSLISRKSRVEKFEVDGKKLTLCQARIISLLTHGLQRKQLAHYLGNSHHTIDTHLDRIYKELGINDSRLVLVWALKNGFDTEGGLNGRYLFQGLPQKWPWNLE